MAWMAPPETVWVGFIDEVPVIGTLKEGVEWVLALYEGNKMVVKEKETVIRKLLTQKPKSLKIPMVKSMKKLTLAEMSPSTQAEDEEDPTAAGASASGSVTAVKIEELLEYVSEVPGGWKEAAKHEEKERARKVEKLKKDIQQMIRLTQPNSKMALQLSLEMRPRGVGHVFNNDILNFHSKVLRHLEDIRNIHPSYGPGLPSHLAEHTLDEDAAEKIKKHMAVEFEMTEFYVNANAVLYGFYSKELRDGYLRMLQCLYPEKPAGGKRLNRITELMDYLEIFVDQLAKAKWISNNPDKQKQFKNVKDKVVSMYKNERGVSWCEHVKAVIRKEYLEDMLKA